MKGKVLLSMLFVLFLVGLVSAAYAQNPVIRLKYSTYFVATHQVAVLNQQFCDEIKKRTNGKVEIVYHPSGTLLSAPKTFQGVVSGIADIGMSNISYTRGRFPVIGSSICPSVFRAPTWQPTWTMTSTTILSQTISRM